MDEKLRFYKNAERVLNFIYIFRFRYIHIDEIKKEVALLHSDAELVSIINYLSNKDYIYLTNYKSKTSIKKIKDLDCDVVIRINLRGMKYLYNNTFAEKFL